MARRRKVPELRVVLDSNAIYTASFGELLGSKIVEALAEHSSHIDLQVCWYLPDIVRHERQYQIQVDAAALLPSVEKIEKLLTHRLNITADTLNERVNSLVERTIAEHKLLVLQADPSKIDWPAVYTAAAYRRPPFDTGKKEKGFRDSLIAEAFLQLVDASPVTPSICRVVLVTADELLTHAVEGRTQTSSNVRIVKSLEELKGLINTLVSQVSEEVVAAVRAKAEKFYFQTDDKQTFVFKDKVLDKIEERYGEKLKEKPEGATQLRLGTWRLHGPDFLKKEGSRFFWTSRFEVEMHAYRYEMPPQLPTSPQPLVLTSSSTPFLLKDYIYNPALPFPSVQYNPTTTTMAYPYTTTVAENFSPTYAGTGLLSSNVGLGPVLKDVATGRGVIEVDWSVSVDSHQRLSNAKTEDIRFVEIKWTLV